MIAKFKVFEKLSEVGEEVICINPNVGRDERFVTPLEFKMKQYNL